MSCVRNGNCQQRVGSPPSYCEKPVQQQNPTTVESVTAEQIAITTAVTNAEDALRYLPNIVVRKRHVGDTFAPITTRSGLGKVKLLMGLRDSFALITTCSEPSSPTSTDRPERVAATATCHGAAQASVARDDSKRIRENRTIGRYLCHTDGGCHDLFNAC